MIRTLAPSVEEGIERMFEVATRRHFDARTAAGLPGQDASVCTGTASRWRRWSARRGWMPPASPSFHHS